MVGEQVVADRQSRISRGRLRRAVTLLLGAIMIGIVGAGALAFFNYGKDSGGTPALVTITHQRPDPGAVYDRTPVTASPSPTPDPTPIPPPLKKAPFHLVIDKIGVDAPVVPEGLDANQVPIVPLDNFEVAWYTFSAQPGTGSNAVFAGHVTWGGPGVFYYLNQLAPGDVVKLQADNGDQLIYTVTDSFMVDENDKDALTVMDPTSDDVVTIISCDGTRYYTGDPIYGHDYTGRRIVRAALTGEHVAAAVNAVSSN